MVPDRMKAVLQLGYGMPEETLQVATGPVPQPRRGEVLVRVNAVSVNSWDVDLVTGPAITRINAPFRGRRRIIGSDVAGEVVVRGDEVTRFEVGDRVVGDLSVSGWGGFAEYVAVPEKALTPIPDEVGDEAAAALPQAGSMAWQALGGADGLASLRGRRVLIVGAGGGVGTFAIQLAHAANAHVTAVDRSPKLVVLRELGADETIEADRLDDVSHPSFDRVIDVVGALTVTQARGLLAPGGSAIVVGGPPGLLFRVALSGTDRDGRRVRLLIARPNRDVAELLKLVASASLTVVVDGPHPLSAVPHQVERLRAGQAIGKIVIVPA
jgi:NADPH:quinone reductase-like Zn-dependent oxidoreductase